MGRAKVKLAWIEKAAPRNVTYKKRKNGLLKKVKDLSTLCDVKACGIIYPCGGTVPEVWSSTPNPMDVLVPFMQESELERRKKMVNQCLEGKDISVLDLETIFSLSWLVDNKLNFVKEKVVKKKAKMVANGE
ncbi:agamous-like MADS-box protein AGL80 [Dioscorea cayenensis subsp. rotundata]|uniref:Agamous-like MADS-box protein AGL80 n=1 Tax=Dioscorea cayennensis subsp. rotundata TaxID=55577 RepID=A0AB40ALL6_DIOCR|nr:agamous-like MADS-box protein AGL80 [Dioscorea cayenensis subsp. rotundata]